MRFILLLLILIFSFNPFIYSNNCYPITKKEKRIVKKLKSYLIKENYYDAKRLLSTETVEKKEVKTHDIKKTITLEDLTNPDKD